MKKLITLGVIVALSISLAGCDYLQSDPLSYSTEGVAVQLSTGTDVFGYTADDLKALADECGTSYEDGYFEELVKSFEGAETTVYNFKYDGESQGVDTYVVTLLPNNAEYSTLEDFQKDFNQCFAAGDLYPKKVSEKWLLFVNSCGSGFNDGSGLPIGCAEVQPVVEPTLELE